MNGEQERPLSGADLAAAGILRVGDVLSTTAKATGTNLVSLCVIAAACLLPALALDLWLRQVMIGMVANVAQDAFAPRDPMAVFRPLLAIYAKTGIVAIARSLLTYVAQAAVVFATLEYLAGRRATVGDALQKGLSRILPVLGTALLTGLAVAAGSILCIVPGVILLCVTFVAVPAAVVERMGPVRAFRRSSQLTSGYRMTIFLSWLVLFAAAVALGIMASAVGGVFQLIIAGTAGGIASVTLSWLVQVVFTVANAVLVAVVYARVRGLRDGVDIEALARVFA